MKKFYFALVISFFITGCKSVQHPMSLNENINTPSKDPKCKENNTGDYSFQNNTKFDLTVTFIPSFTVDSYQKHLTCTLQPNQTQCFYDVYNGPANYEVVSWKGGNPLVFSSASDFNYKANGTLYVESCKSKTFIIK